MPTGYIFGAGASASYTGGIHGERPPLQSNFWDMLLGSDATATMQVRRGEFYTYIDDANLQGPDGKILLTVEELMTKVHKELLVSLQSGKGPMAEIHPGRIMPIYAFRLVKLYQDLVLALAQTVNNLSVGKPCSNYKVIVDRVSPGDILVTFNWDVILDRVLQESRRWNPEKGYGISFGYILDGKWRRPNPHCKKSHLTLFKLHGSTNWLIPYMVFDWRVRRRLPLFLPKTNNIPVCYVNCTSDLPSYHDLYTPLGPFCYGFPPNHPELPKGGYLYPIIVPPSRIKSYDELPGVLPKLWREAVRKLRQCNEVKIIGYSFPEADEMSWHLIRGVTKHPGRVRKLTVIDPSPEPIVTRLRERLDPGIRIFVRKETFQKYANWLRRTRGRS